MTDTTTAAAGASTAADPAPAAASLSWAPSTQPAAVLNELSTILESAATLVVTVFSLQVGVSMPDGGNAYLGLTLSRPTAPPTGKTGSVTDVLSTIGTAISDNAGALSETMTVENGYTCQVAVTRG